MNDELHVLVGSELVLEVGAVAHGGHCVARHDGRVVFVRHTLPGERVRARVTEARTSYLRADAVEILVASPDRVQAPCQYAGPDNCGGCDWQHADPAAQRRFKADVVCEQFTRLAGLDVRELLGEVAELPGGPLHWRTRVEYAVGRDGRAGLRRHRSHAVVPVDACLLGVAGVGDSPELAQRRPGLGALSLVRGDGPDAPVTVLGHRVARGESHGRRRRIPGGVDVQASASGPAEVLAGPDRVRREVGSHRLSVAAGGFWQGHARAATVYAETVLELLAPRAGESVVELYAGAGALTVPLADAVGPTGRVLALEGNAQAVADAEANLTPYPWARTRRAAVGASVVTALTGELTPDLVVLDPPRTGAGIETTRALLALGPRAVAYVGCDPAALARDVAVARGEGWEVTALRGFDAFPMTHHVECIALLVPARRHNG
jgi:tRNA/tmRNA/rRNA uracil-C5-methylase (TrmA/RlmC/RlmD family)